MRHYWGYRINTDRANFFWEELENGRLRQGWGYDPGQDLRIKAVNEGAFRNLRMLNVKKGDILLIPRIHQWNEVSIVEATEDWNLGYRYEIDQKHGDYGHIFPARFLKDFRRDSEAVSGDVRSSLRNPMRFWNMDRYGKSVEQILAAEQSILTTSQKPEDRFINSIVDVFGSAFDGSMFSNDLFDKMCNQVSAAEWEFVLVAGLKLLYPEPYFHVQHTGGRSEVNHGTDITITFPSIAEETEYVIAIQVKDYEGYVARDVIAQINKAEAYFKEQNQILIDKIVIITKAPKDVNQMLVDNSGDVKFIFANELKTLLSVMGRQYIAKYYLATNAENNK